MNNQNFGECGICGQGALLPVRDVASGKLLVMCDDCESQWRTPEEAQSYEKVLKNEVKRVVDASPEEVRAAGWDKYLEGGPNAV